MNRNMKTSSEPWIGLVPSDWDESKIKYVAPIHNERAESNEGYIGLENIEGWTGKLLPSDSTATGESISFLKDDVLFGKLRPYLAKSVVAHENGCGSTELLVMRPENINPNYLGYICRSKTFVDCIDVSTYGAKMPRANGAFIGNLHIPMPSEIEQRTIVSYLDAKCAAIDEAIERHKKIIEKLEEYKRSSIIKAVNGDISDNAKASGIAWMPTVPSHWGVVPMRFALTQRKNKNEGLVEKNLLTLSYGKIKRKDIETNEGLLPASFEGYNIIEAGDIVLRLMDLQNDKHSLRTGLVTERGIITSAYVTVIPTEGFDPAYCRYLLHAYDLMKVFYSMGEGVRQGLTYDDLSRTLLIPKPPIDEQSKIASNIIKMEGSVDASIGKQNAMLEKLEEYRKSIIYNAVTGKIDCRTEAVE